MVDRVKVSSARRSLSHEWEKSARLRIAAQTDLVATLRPGCEAHRLATETLLLFQDSLHLLIEARRTLAIARVRLGGWR